MLDGAPIYGPLGFASVDDISTTPVDMFPNFCWEADAELKVTVNGPISTNPGITATAFVQDLAPVPLPAAAWLLLSSLAGMGVLAGRPRR
jgi:hypothetical protein